MCFMGAKNTKMAIRGLNEGFRRKRSKNTHKYPCPLAIGTCRVKGIMPKSSRGLLKRVQHNLFHLHICTFTHLHISPNIP